MASGYSHDKALACHEMTVRIDPEELAPGFCARAGVNLHEFLIEPWVRVREVGDWHLSSGVVIRRIEDDGA